MSIYHISKCSILALKCSLQFILHFIKCRYSILNYINTTRDFLSSSFSNCLNSRNYFVPYLSAIKSINCRLTNTGNPMPSRFSSIYNTFTCLCCCLSNSKFTFFDICNSVLNRTYSILCPRLNLILSSTHIQYIVDVFFYIVCMTSFLIILLNSLLSFSSLSSKSAKLNKLRKDIKYNIEDSGSTNNTTNTRNSIVNTITCSS